LSEGARRSADAAAEKIRFTGMFYRKDIGERALKSSGRES
jgi:phosphoribosylamine-glycine ligase